MSSIEPKRETIVKYSIIITLDDEEEINRFLVDPAPLQKQVRAARNQLYGHPPAARAGKTAEKNRAEVRAAGVRPERASYPTASRASRAAC